MDPSAHAMLSVRSIRAGRPIRACARPSRAKITAPVSRPRASSAEGSRACFAASMNANYARQLT
jgi:hypothetical protein